VTESDNSGWEAKQLAALRGLSLEDMPGLEFLLLDGLRGWIRSDANPGGGYEQDHAAQLSGVLLMALGHARSFRPGHTPVLSADVLTARQRVVAGARELGQDKQLQLLFSRLMPGAVGELRKHAGDRDAQVRSLYLYFLLVLASGTRASADLSSTPGLTASFDAWDALQVAESGTVAPPERLEDYPPVTWLEVHEHLVRRLFIDDEWRVDDDQRFSWWPGFLRQDVAVTATDSGSATARPDALLRVRATTEVLQVREEALGLQIVAEANRQFPYGAFILRDHTIVATSSVALNPMCRGMLNAFHQAMLVQATVAHELAVQHREAPGVSILASSHPRSGRRDDPDDLLQIYAGEESALPLVDGFGDYLAAARPVYRQLLLDGGLEEGFSAEDVDFFNADQIDVAVGTIEGDPLERRYGPGLVVITRFLTPGSWIPAIEVNAMNDDISQLADGSQLGPVLGDERAIKYGLHTKTYLDQGFLASVRGDTPDKLATEIVNAVYHSMATVRLLLDSIG
jgi:hypothetical protein